MIAQLLSLPRRTLRPLWRVYARLRRATVHPSVIFNGRPVVRCVAGATLRIEEGVIVNSRVSSNPVIGRLRSGLCAVADGAELILERDVGVSGVSITAARSVVVGEGTLLGADCLITDTDFHLPGECMRWATDTRAVSAPVSIGKRCFLGARSMVLKGVTIGDGAVVAAGAVVTKNVPAEYLAFGNPATVRPLPGRWKFKATEGH